MEELEQLVWKHALKNRVDYGKAAVGSIAGKVIAEQPEAKSKMKELMALIAKKAAEANKLSDSKAADEMSKYSFFEKKEEGEKVWMLPGCEKGKVVTRFLPEPNGYPHLGHAKAAWLSRTFADQWQGKCILRFDDTNPEKENNEYEQAIRKDLAWLGLKFDANYYTSDFMPQIYSLAEKLFAKGKGYVCTCAQEQIAKGREKKKACACRKRTAKENTSLWKQMLSKEVKEGQAVVRFSGDMASENSVMRDPTLFRIIEAPHYRQGKKYRVWPTYDFAQIVDSLTGVTHALRSKEYELRDELYYSLLDALELRKPFVYGFSRLNIKGSVLSKRSIKPLVESGKLSGWDDPRLLTLGGVRRRGLLPSAIKNFVLSFGLSKVESAPSTEKLLVENRKLLDPLTERRFFADSPVELQVSKHPKSVSFATVHNHPTDKSKGVRQISALGEYYVCGSDAQDFSKDTLFRLKDLYNVKVTKKGKAKLEGEYAGTDLVEGKKVQWVPKQDALPCVLQVPGQLFDENEKLLEGSLVERKGYCEKSCGELKVGDVVQFERVGFARLDSKGKELVFIFSC